MKTLADFKRALQPNTIWLRKHVNEGDFTKRVVSRAASNGIWVKDETGKEIRLDFPKASEFEINGQGEAEIYFPASELWNLPRRLVLTYKKCEA